MSQEETELCTTEATAAVEEISKISAVKEISISEKLEFTPDRAYLNIKTLEDKVMCVQICRDGWSKVSEKYDDESEPSGSHFRSINTLMCILSKSFNIKLTENLYTKSVDTYAISYFTEEEPQEIAKNEAVIAVKELIAISAVPFIAISTVLPLTDRLAYVNVNYAPGKDVCLEVGTHGWRIASDLYDHVGKTNPSDETQKETRYYETIYTLLSALSDDFRTKFADALSNRLRLLEQTDPIS